MTWLPLAEQTLDEMETPSSSPQNLKTQIEELKVSQCYTAKTAFNIQCMYYSFQGYSMRLYNVYFI